MVGRDVGDSGEPHIPVRRVEVTANLVRLLVLARLLGPVPFGLFGLALLAVTALDTFTNIGLLPALIQTRQPLEDYLPTAWSLSLLRGVILGGGALLLGPTIASFFSRPDLEVIVQVGPERSGQSTNCGAGSGSPLP